MSSSSQHQQCQFRYRSVPISKANLIQYGLPTHLHDYREVYVACILKATHLFLPIGKSLFVISLLDSHVFDKVSRLCQTF